MKSQRILYCLFLLFVSYPIKIIKYHNINYYQIKMLELALDDYPSCQSLTVILISDDMPRLLAALISYWKRLFHNHINSL